MNEDFVKEYLRDLWKSLFPHQKTVRYVLTAFVIVFLLAMATKCHAESVSFETGVQYLRGPAAAVVAGTRWDGPGDAQWEAGLVLVGRSPHDLGVAGVQAQFIDGFGRFDIGLGMAYFNRIPDLLGSNLNFSLLVGYRITDHWAVNIRHFSNAGTTPRNTGLDLVLVSYRFGSRQ